MVLNSALALDITSSAICAALILSRCAYRIFFPCRIHSTCHRRWRIDDFYMAFAILPLVGRTASIVMSFVLNPAQRPILPTDDEAAALGMPIDQIIDERSISRKLLIPSRICYALFLWVLKLCLLSFYSRFIGPISWGKRAIDVLWWFVVITFVAIVAATLAECRPLHLAWELVPAGQAAPACSRGVINLLTMAVGNIITDIALIALPFPILRKLRLDRKTKFQLGVLFGIGGVVVVITIVRIPLILVSSVSQRSRTMWASIEILCACIVANTAFFYAVVKDMQGHRHRTQPSSGALPSGTFYLQSLPSQSVREVTNVSKTQKKGDVEELPLREESEAPGRTPSNGRPPSQASSKPTT